MKVSFVTVSYNNYEITSNYVASIKFMRGYENFVDKIVIVDNCSNDDDYYQLKKNLEEEPKVIIIRSNKNVGYSKGINIGLEYLSNEKYSYIICGNNDILFSRDFLNNLEKTNYNDDVYMIDPDIITLNGCHQNPQRESPKRNWKDKIQDFAHCSTFTSIIFNFSYLLFKNFIIRSKQNTNIKSRYIHTCTGAIFIFTRAYIQNCKIMEPIVFMWCEETILAAQILSKGGKTYLDSNLKVKHLENASVNSIRNIKKIKMYNNSYKISRTYIKRTIGDLE